MPQWQGGDYDLPPVTGEIYPLGARLLSFLAPKSETTPEFEVPVAPYEPEFPIYLYIAGFRRQFSSPSRSKTSLWRPKISPSQTFPVDEL